MNTFWMAASAKYCYSTILALPLRKMWQNTGFLGPVLSCIRPKSLILSVYGKIRIRGNPYSATFYAVYMTFEIQLESFAKSWKYNISMAKKKKQSETYSELYLTSKTAKTSILDVWQGFEYASYNNDHYSITFTL